MLSPAPGAAGPPRIRLQLVSPEEPVAIRRSDTGLIRALLNVTGGGMGEETRRRTSVAENLHVACRGKLKGRGKL